MDLTFLFSFTAFVDYWKEFSPWIWQSRNRWKKYEHFLVVLITAIVLHHGPCAQFDDIDRQMQTSRLSSINVWITICLFFSESGDRLSVLQRLHLHSSREHHGHFGLHCHHRVHGQVQRSLSTQPRVSQHRKTHLFQACSSLSNSAHQWDVPGHLAGGLRVWPGHWEVRDDSVGGQTAATQPVGSHTALWSGRGAIWASFRHECRL